MIIFFLVQIDLKIVINFYEIIIHLYLGMISGKSVKEFVEACKKATGVDIKVDYLSRRPGDYAEVYSDPSKIRRELNWSAQHTDLLESLRIAWNWQRSHRDGYELLPLAMVS
eukprot:TRINITY_DN2286_c0_g1_i1.p1 TRINITY_DN2286_c0_g1~~TRINITY_DN2286_c0_g1_i1.p1  ORF type:complete len:112 (-),score=10.64 TRINITY_DN2286_c0_g1_i1:331-666(-)